MKISDFLGLKKEIARMCLCLREDGVPEEAVFASRVVAHELLTNALTYGGGAQFSYEKSGQEICIAVQADSAFRPPEKTVCADLYAERGRGLYLVDALSRRREYSEERGICVFIDIYCKHP